jgi:DNA-binding MarR family transcriptional regulator
MEPLSDELLKQAVSTYRRYWLAVLQSAEGDWSKLELSISQLKGLMLLEARTELAVGSLGIAMDMSRPSASILVEQLVQLGLATRTEDTKDRRRALVRLTELGREQAAKLHRGDEEHLQRVFERLKPNELSALIVGLDSLTAALLESSRMRGLQADHDSAGASAAEIDEETSADAGGLSEEGCNG